MELRVTAPAKVNWHLQVGEKRQDGFHEIVSLFQKISLCDELNVSYEEASSFSFSVSGLEDYCEQGKSTLDKAALLWHRKTGLCAKVHADIKKNIPSQSGLGGGSSDAASFLMALERLAGYPLSPLSLLDISAKVGSDVPFFIACCDAALVTGRGEFVCPVEARHDLSGYLLFPKAYKVSTAKAYEEIDKRCSFDGFLHESDIINMYNRKVAEWNFENDFVCVNPRPSVCLGKEKQLLLTGSGSCWVMVTDSKTFCESELHDFDGTFIRYET